MVRQKLEEAKADHMVEVCGDDGKATPTVVRLLSSLKRPQLSLKMPQPPNRLSELVRQQIEDDDKDFLDELSDSERIEAEESKAFADRITRILLHTRAWLVAADFAKIDELCRRDPEFLEARIDEHYTRRLLEDVPKFVKRTLKLTPLWADTSPSRPVNTYLREATRSYIFGHWQATVALSRAALEAGLRERLEQEIGPAQSRTKLSDLLDRAGKLRILPSAEASLAMRVQMEGNDALHGKPTGGDAALDTLSAVRGVIAKLYRQ